MAKPSWLRMNWPLLVALVFLVTMTTTCASAGNDFQVYWRTARALISGEPVYSLAREGNMVFKYPPWILPVFLPFALLPLAVAKAVWGFVLGLCLVATVDYLQRKKVGAPALVIATVAFAPIWTNHAWLGQIALPMLVAGLYLSDVYEKNARGWKFQALAYAFSAKIFTLFPFLALRFSGKKDLKPALRTGGLWALLTVPFVVFSRGGLRSLISSWTASATSGAVPVAGVHVTIRGREAQGFPSLIFRVFDLPDTNKLLILAIVVVCGLVAASAWSRASKKLPAHERWAGWLAFTATAQPLAGFYSFVLAFPLAACALDRAIRVRRWRFLLLAFSGVMMTIALTLNSMGDVWGERFETISIKSWGVVACAAALVLASRVKPGKWKF